MKTMKELKGKRKNKVTTDFTDLHRLKKKQKDESFATEMPTVLGNSVRKREG